MIEARLCVWLMMLTDEICIIRMNNDMTVMVYDTICYEGE